MVPVGSAPIGRLRFRTRPGTLRDMPMHVTRPSGRSLGIAPALALVAALVAGVIPAAAAEPDYPSYDSRYHSYGEVLTEIRAAEVAYPGLVQVLSIGRSYEGREIWAVKVSDNVTVDEPETEVLVDALHHARERLGLEQAIYLLRLLTRNYASDAVVRRLVDNREVWIVFALNPDGFAYDLSGNPYNLWRKNRQPTPGSRYIGTDLNRNYDYHWGCCGGSSGNPAAWNYRGPRAFSAPEAQRLRDFVNSRVIDGRQQIKVHITLHTNGEQVLWPYGYTKANIPADMSADDHAAFVALGRGTARLNGYRPMQSSDLYVTDGDQIDWMYGRHRIFSFTWELYPPETPSDRTDHYSPDEIIAPQTARNRTALLYMLSQASCPWGVIGKARANCGALFDDLEINRGWVRNPDGTDTATAGRWEVANPVGTYWHGAKQAGTTVSGSRDLVTGAAAGSSGSSNDLDGGATTIRSTPVVLPATVGPLSFRYYLAHGNNSSPSDWLRVWVEAADGTRTLVFEELGAANNDNVRVVDGADPHDAVGGPGRSPRHRGRGRCRGERGRGRCRRHPDRAPVTPAG